MRETRLSGSEGGGTPVLPTPIHHANLDKYDFQPSLRDLTPSRQVFTQTLACPIKSTPLSPPFR
jgi:hypothetical protein